MNEVIIGTYYKTRKLANKEMRRKNKTGGRNAFDVLGFKNGFIVCSKGQLENCTKVQK